MKKQSSRSLREAEQHRAEINTICRRQNITEQALYRWTPKHDGIQASDARRLKNLEAENSEIKLIVAKRLLVIHALKGSSRES